VNATGRFGVAAAATRSTIRSPRHNHRLHIGNASATLGSFDLGTSINTTVNMSGGTIVAQLAATAIDYRYDAVTSSWSYCVNLANGNAASGAAKRLYSWRCSLISS